jgi:hypothetical protein
VRIGANTALRDARLLCHALTGGGDPVEAIAGYRARMREYGFAAIRDSLGVLIAWSVARANPGDQCGRMPVSPCQGRSLFHFRRGYARVGATGIAK